MPLRSTAMHVADVTMFYAPHGGGVRRYIEAKRDWLLASAGCSHTLLVPRARNDPPEAHTIGLPSLPLPFSNGYRVTMRRAPAVHRLVSLRPSVIEAGDPYNLAWAALAAADELGVPAVAFCHSDLPRLLGRRYGPRAERLASLYCARLYRHFDLVLAPSRGMTARLQAWGVKHAVHQPLGVDTVLFHPNRRDLDTRRNLGFTPDTRVLVYAGRFAAEKNLDVLTDAMRMLGPRYAAVLVGAGRVPPDLPQNVRVLPYVSGRKALAQLLASCDAFVHPGDQETFGLAALEAMASGLPVVGADAAGIGELVTADSGVLVEPRSADALAHGIDHLFTTNIAETGLRARALAEQYAWPAVLESMIGRYAALRRERGSSERVH